ncbi:hypothetical protein ACFFX0_24520 [Citricoccus parietis]|uniref:Uncharacterized protein n=1 Tax=Citricoccus parietis TaxID=592307 RepID=A0ABV5G5G5_9MICC
MATCSPVRCCSSPLGPESPLAPQGVPGDSTPFSPPLGWPGSVVRRINC